MSTIASACLCGSIGAPKQIRRCDEHHTYWFSDRRLDSVSAVIKAVYPTDYSKVDPMTLEGARLRGMFIDAYFSEWLTDPENVVPVKDAGLMVEPHFPQDNARYSADVVQRLERLLEWWAKSKMKAVAVQGMVFSDADSVAGTFDIATEDRIIDLKAVSSLQPAYRLQLGSYLTMDTQKFPLREAAILHVQKDKVRLVPYDATTCKRQWSSALSWYKTLNELK